MPLKTDKNILKQYFRSGSRPTQRQFHELIDSCYNEGLFTSFVSGYQLLTDTEQDNTIHILKREGGNTVLVPSFKRINVRHQRVYHYAIPVCNMGREFVLDKVVLEMGLPPDADYDVQDKRTRVRISQKVSVKFITIYNGTKEIWSAAPGSKRKNGAYEIEIGKPAGRWHGIGIDIGVEYNIRSDIAVSDQFDIAAGKEEMLTHTFGSAGCLFNEPL